MKVIFLDIDGVLNSTDYMHELIDNNVHEYENDIYQFIDENAVNIIVNLCKEYNLKLVITSSWRHFNLESTLEYFKEIENKKIWSLIPYIIGVTPRAWIEKEDGHLDFLDRGYEIEKYLNENKEIDEYVILDDDTDMLESQKEHFIHIDGKHGLNDCYINEIKKILNIVKN